VHTDMCYVELLSVRAVIKIPQPILAESFALRERLEGLLGRHMGHLLYENSLPPARDRKAHGEAVTNKIKGPAERGRSLTNLTRSRAGRSNTVVVLRTPSENMVNNRMANMGQIWAHLRTS
jgi:hypothetical protein